MPLALEIRGLWKRYTAGAGGSTITVEALRDVDFTVSRGEVVAVAGSCGAGKTTLLLCAAGLLRPSAGTVAWFGAARRSWTARGGLPPRHVAYVRAAGAREVAPAGAGSTLRGWLEHAARRCGRLTRERRRAVDDGLIAAALADHADAIVAELPGAARRRVGLAHALLDRPALLLVDDLISGSIGVSRAGPHDPGDGDAPVVRCLHALAERGVAVVFAAPELGSATRLASRTAVLRDGRFGASPTIRTPSGAGSAGSGSPCLEAGVRVAERAQGSPSSIAAGRLLR